MNIAKYEGELKTATAIFADLKTGKRISIADVERAIETLDEAADQLFNQAEQIEATKYKARMPQDPGAAAPPEPLNNLFTASHWLSFVNRAGETVRYVSEAGWLEQEQAEIYRNPDLSMFCKRGRKASSSFQRRCNELKTKLGITQLNALGEDLNNLRYQLEDKLLDLPSQSCAHLVVKAKLIERICAGAESVSADMVELLAADAQRLLSSQATPSPKSKLAA